MILMSPCPFFSNDGTTRVIWAVSSYPGWMPISVSLSNNYHESELLFGHPEPWLSYSSNVPDLSCKDRSGGYWFICRFLARVRMIISLWSKLERWWTCHSNNSTMSGNEDKSTHVRILPSTEAMVTQWNNMTRSFTQGSRQESSNEGARLKIVARPTWCR